MSGGRDGAATLQDVFAASRATDDLSHAELRLWLVIRSYDGQGDGCFASSSTLASDLGVSVSYVEKMRTRLREEGWLTLRHRGPKEPALQAVVPKGLHQSADQEAEGPHHSEEQTAKALQSGLHYSANRIRGIRKNPLQGEKLLSKLERFTDEQREVVDRAFAAFASTRQRGEMAVSIPLKELRYYEERGFDPETVVAGFQVYLEKDYADDGKDENYARGIVRNDPNPSTNGRPSGPRPDGRDELAAMKEAAGE